MTFDHVSQLAYVGFVFKSGTKLMTGLPPTEEAEGQLLVRTPEDEDWQPFYPEADDLAANWEPA